MPVQGLPPGYQERNGNSSDMMTFRQLAEQLLARQTQATGPVTLNISPAGGEGKSSVELTEGAKGELRVSIKVYSNDTQGAAASLSTAVESYKQWMREKAAIEAAKAPPVPPPASETLVEASKPKKAKKEATE